MIIRAIKDGDFHDMATWEEGAIPGLGDDAQTNGHAIEIKAECRCRSVQSVDGGSFRVYTRKPFVFDAVVNMPLRPVGNSYTLWLDADAGLRFQNIRVAQFGDCHIKTMDGATFSDKPGEAIL